MEFCRGLWDADKSQLDAMAELYQRAHALIMGRVACEVMSGNFAQGVLTAAAAENPRETSENVLSGP